MAVEGGDREKLQRERTETRRWMLPILQGREPMEESSTGAGGGGELEWRQYCKKESGGGCLRDSIFSDKTGRQPVRHPGPQREAPHHHHHHNLLPLTRADVCQWMTLQNISRAFIYIHIACCVFRAQRNAWHTAGA